MFVSVDPNHDAAERLAKFVEPFDPTVIALTGTTAQVERIISTYQTFVERAPLAGSVYTESWCDGISDGRRGQPRHDGEPNGVRRERSLEVAASHRPMNRAAFFFGSPLAASFLSTVADRFSLWGPPGAKGWRGGTSGTCRRLYGNADIPLQGVPPGVVGNFSPSCPRHRSPPRLEAPRNGAGKRSAPDDVRCSMTFRCRA